MRNGWLGVAAAVLLAGTAAGAAAAIDDPFEDARYQIGISDAPVLAAIDSGRVSVNQADRLGYTLLHYAADANRLELVKALLARGADPTLRSKSGTTAYDMASQPTVKLALAAKRPAAGGRPGGGGVCAAVQAEPVNNGRSPALRPLLKARDSIWYNQPEQLAALLDDCVDANAKDPGGATLLHEAASRDRVDAARILLAHGARRTTVDASGKVPAAYARSPEMRALLGAAPASPAAAAVPADRKVACEQFYRADVALASDLAGKSVAMRKWTQCLKTGRYW